MRAHEAGRGARARRGRALVPLAVAALVAACAGGCGAGGAGEEPGAGRGTAGASGETAPDGEAAGGAAVTERGFVSFVAALTVAVDEGKRGEEAGRRAVELGAPPYRREDVEAFAAVLREDPERWVRLAALIDKRVLVLEARTPRADEGVPATGAASRP